MACSNKFQLGLFVAYVISMASALANPARVSFEDAYLWAQGANIIMLLVLSYCKQRLGNAFLASQLAVAFAFRATGTWQGGSRWDSLLVTVGMFVILQDAFVQAVPAAVPHKRLLYLVFSLFLMPAIFAIPHLVRQPKVSKPMIETALRYATEAYKVGPKSDAGLLGPLWTLYDPKTNTRAAVTQVLSPDNTQDIYVYFAGSESTENWLTNINIAGDLVPEEWQCSSTKPLRTHRGFTKAFASVADKMIVALQNELNAASTPATNIVFCGHSLGGALATMAALCTACRIPSLRPNISVVTFGSPQVGDANFVAYFNSVVPRSVRVVNPMDPVPRLLNAQFVHVDGYYPIGAFSLDSVFDAHTLSNYGKALQLSRATAIMAAFMPAVIGGLLIGVYILWQLV